MPFSAFSLSQGALFIELRHPDGINSYNEPYPHRWRIRNHHFLSIAFLHTSTAVAACRLCCYLVTTTTTTTSTTTTTTTTTSTTTTTAAAAARRTYISASSCSGIHWWYCFAHRRSTTREVRRSGNLDPRGRITSNRASQQSPSRTTFQAVLRQAVYNIPPLVVCEIVLSPCIYLSVEISRYRVVHSFVRADAQRLKLHTHTHTRTARSLSISVFRFLSI